ncbi:NUDIX domain-containing protein [Candidatus Dependentiae bacterium]|nr:NUDIX domain-containing protein [Candidatus Dependentiae bacterium]
MKKETSAGIITFYVDRDEGKPFIKYLVLNAVSGYWDFPKGKVEENEELIDTAKRELFEEAGIEVDIIPGFQEQISYMFRDKDKELVSKKVVYFLGKAKSDIVKISYEHVDFKWLPYNEVLKQLTFHNAQEILKIANEFILLRQNNAF